MNKRSYRLEKEMEQRRKTENCLRFYEKTLLEEMNLRLICGMETKDSGWEQVLWVEEVVLTDICYPDSRKSFRDQCKGIGAGIVKAGNNFFSKLRKNNKKQKRKKE